MEGDSPERKKIKYITTCLWCQQPSSCRRCQGQGKDRNKMGPCKKAKAQIGQGIVPHVPAGGLAGLRLGTGWGQAGQEERARIPHPSRPPSGGAGPAFPAIGGGQGESRDGSSPSSPSQAFLRGFSQVSRSFSPAPYIPPPQDREVHREPSKAVSRPRRSWEVLGAAEAMWIIMGLALLGLAAAVPSEDRKLSDKATTLAERSTTLAFNLYHAMAKDKDMENILLSPVVVASSLGLVSLGGKATTASQAKAVLSADKLNDDYVHSGLSELLSEVSNSTARNVTWKIGNRLYGPASITFAEDFVKNSKKHYNYEHSKINFRDKRSALKSINEWAAQTTDGKLPEVTKDVEKTDGALIVNAMFFKPHWDEKFHHKMVDNRGFMVTRSYTVGVPMMHRTGLYNYYDDEAEKLQVVEMPLAHKLSSMIFIMPNHVEPLERVEKLLNKEQLKTWTGKMKKRSVAISLPKVVLEVSHDLQKHLGGLGLTEAIDKTKADLSKISGKKDLYLSNVFHAAALEWDTEGNPYDADIYGREEMRNPKLFYADHPFIFMIKDTKTNSILFIGRLVRPKGDKMRDEL
uniref:Serpin H1 n=2 Tax=Passeriformes TaxID=9126 RepID=A0A674HHC4_TAEGU